MAGLQTRFFVDAALCFYLDYRTQERFGLLDPAFAVVFLPRGTILMRHKRHGFLNRRQNPVLASIIANLMAKFCAWCLVDREAVA